VYDQIGETVVPPHPFAAPIASVLWSPNSDAVLVETARGATHFWYLPVASRVVASPLTALQQATDSVWDPRIPGRLLYLDGKQTLQAYNVRSQALATLVTNIAKFATSANHLYAIQVDTKLLTEYTLQGQATGTEISLPAGNVSQLVVTPQENIAARLASGEIWLLGDAGQFEQIATGIVSLAWSPSGKVLLLTARDSALYVFNVNDKRTTLPLRELHLVQRLSRPITDPQWFAGGRHLIYQVDDALWITETDTRDHPVSYEVDTTNTGVAQAAVGEEGVVIFYLKNTGRDTALVAASLLVP
jgi:WD40 repeat protein